MRLTFSHVLPELSLELPQSLAAFASVATVSPLTPLFDGGH